jgi:hypothetical protein
MKTGSLTRVFSARHRGVSIAIPEWAMHCDLHVHTMHLGICAFPPVRQLRRESFSFFTSYLAQCGVFTAVGLAIKAITLGKYLVEQVFARRWMMEYRRLRAPMGRDCAATPFAEWAA